MFNYQNNVLLIDDDFDILESYADLLQQEGYSVFATAEPKEIINQIPENWCGVVICDVLLPGISGLDLLGRIIEIDSQIPVIMITGHGDVPMAVEAVKKGATNFFEKPVSPEKLLIQVDNALKKRKKVIEKRQWQMEKINDVFIGSSVWINELKKQLQKLANSNLPVFIWGEIGTGRHLAATYLHKLSDRETLPMVFHECTQNDNINIIELIKETKSGTLVIKNVHYLPVEEQQYLIQILHHDESQFRLILLSDTELNELIRYRQISAEFYYLFIYTQIEMLPLRKHITDVADIFTHYVKNICVRLNKPIVIPDKKMLQNLRNKEWHGNVKELINVAELYAIGLLSHIPLVVPPVFNDPQMSSLDEQLNQYEKQLIEDALVFYQGKINDVVKHLNIPRKKLYLRMKKYGLDKKSYKL
ncbi:Fis family transcriptional regulator [Aggregatibacter actinomycetemcomitans]|uniref:sigma-54-dependent transcriptional regulator n=2 Tax=Aggregatibacter actinomycetemcomitans TaxID=714 RepID=UPI00022AC41D|nr:sigma-54 dependent transcriptional regulator [Aggregatibacter actinomycetemcomitans]ANU82303.1 Fis family transcriptional regulator [Aggregatibacter actinomycetemcomitans]KOE65912.1 Fis family transcriptional regulator [Aggregatibacter actinomycetemcomitans serotype e str. SCC393]KOE67198.1 Fis family transcriptional regulator [Aggregatibacter actinomycetemcomitans serotype d str. I63B]KOE70455.1 Fis family transcriptional regulator [Aggregatibacter actinomycetemcomitans serotype f str. D18P